MNYHVAAPHSRVPDPFYRLIAFPLKRCLGLFIASLILMFFVNGTVFAELDPLKKYDNFNAKRYNGCKYCINPEKWLSTGRGDYLTEKETTIKAKSLRLKQRSWANTDSNKWREWGRNRLQFRDSGRISGVCVTPQVRKIELNNCKKNDYWNWAAVGYNGNFYDTDANDAGGEDGVVYAGLRLWRSNNSDDKKGKFEVWGYVEECEGYDCDEDAYFIEDFLGTVNGRTNSKPICVGYDKVGHKIVLSVGNKVVNVTGGRGLPEFDSRVEVDWSWHVLEVLNAVQNCKDGPLTGYVDGEFDDVMIRKYPKGD